MRLSETGPISTAFWRSALAIPIIFILFRIKFSEFKETIKTKYIALIFPGIFLGIDHAAWHHGIMLTSVANATLFACMAPVFVIIYGWFLFSWKVSFKYLLSLIIVFSYSLTISIGLICSLSLQKLSSDCPIT